MGMGIHQTWNEGMFRQDNGLPWPEFCGNLPERSNFNNLAAIDHDSMIFMDGTTMVS